LLLLLQVTYGSFGVVWDLGAFGLLNPAQEEAAYLWAELASKVGRACECWGTVCCCCCFENVLLALLGQHRSSCTSLSETAFMMFYGLGSVGVQRPRVWWYCLTLLARRCCCCCQILISTVLLFSNFVTRDMRRLALMRSIESQSKQQLIGELRQLVAQKDAFMSSVSHELRTPLNGIIGGWAQLLLHCSQQADQCMAVLHASMKRLLLQMRTPLNGIIGAHRWCGKDGWLLYGSRCSIWSQVCTPLNGIIGARRWCGKDGCWLWLQFRGPQVCTAWRSARGAAQQS
jgi:hypothetical protein